MFKRKERTRIYYTSDIHGSERCWRKFLNAGKFYGADILLMGGDITGKIIVPIVKHSSGYHQARYMGTEQSLTTVSELENFEKGIRDNGHYPVRMAEDELDLYSYVPGVFVLHRLAFDCLGESVDVGRLLAAILLAGGLALWVLAARRLLPRWVVVLVAIAMLVAPGPWHKGYVRLAHSLWLAPSLHALYTGRKSAFFCAGMLSALCLGLRIAI